MTVKETGTNTEPDEPYVPPLSTLYYYLTEGCNLACRHCWLSPKFDATGDAYPALPLEVFRHTIEEAKPLGLQSIKLTGGEPLLHPQCEALLDCARAADVDVMIETNGLLCTPARVERIAALKNPFVSVSIDGADADTHEWLRGVKGSFDKACHAVRLLAAAGIRPQVVMTIIGRNVHQVEAVIRMAENLGAASVKFNLVQPTARGKNLHEGGHTVSVKDLIDLGRRVESELAAATPLDLIYDYPPAFRSLGRIARGQGLCGILGILGVLSTGHYALCGIGMHEKELVFGKAIEDNLSNVWRNSPVLNRIRAGLPDWLRGICNQCLMKGHCLGACVAQNYYSTGTLWGPYWMCKQASEQGLFPATRRKT